jgi:hypothetical protein
LVPDITVPGALTFSGGMLRTARLVPARLRYTAGNVTSARESAVSGLAAVPKLDRLRRFDKLMNGDEVDLRFQLIWQRTMEGIEAAFEAVNQRVDDLSAILARLTAAEELAQAANDTAVAAVAQVEVVSAAVAETFTEVDPVFGDSFTDRLEP